MKNGKRLFDSRCKINKYDIIKYLKSKNFLAQKSSKVLFKFTRFAKINFIEKQDGKFTKIEKKILIIRCFVEALF